jgi:hypothetical protein
MILNLIGILFIRVVSCIAIANTICGNMSLSINIKGCDDCRLSAFEFDTNISIIAYGNDSIDHYDWIGIHHDYLPGSVVMRGFQPGINCTNSSALIINHVNMVIAMVPLNQTSDVTCEFEFNLPLSDDYTLVVLLRNLGLPPPNRPIVFHRPPRLIPNALLSNVVVNDMQLTITLTTDDLFPETCTIPLQFYMCGALFTRTSCDYIFTGINSPYPGPVQYQTHVLR